MTEEKKTNWLLFLGLGCGIPVFIAVVALVGCFVMGGTIVHEAAENVRTEQKAQRRAVQGAGSSTNAEAQVSDISFTQMKRELSDPDATDLQKDRAWENKYEGRIVQWTGEVTDITESGRIMLKLGSQTLISDVTVHLQPGEVEKAIDVSVGDPLTVRGILAGRGGIITDYRLDEAVIVE